MITNREEVNSLANQLELHYLRNPERGLLFALLTDFSDADSETLPEDEDLVQYATAVIEQLNTKYNAHSSRIFNDRGSETGQEESLISKRIASLLLPSSKTVVEPI